MELNPRNQWSQRRRRSSNRIGFWRALGMILLYIVITFLVIVLLLLALSVMALVAPQMKAYLLLFIQGMGYVLSALFAMAIVMGTNPCLLVFFVCALGLVAWLVGRRSRW